MVKKDIRALVKKQVETTYPDFAQLKRKEKKRVLKEACDEVMRLIREPQAKLPELTRAELLGLEDIDEGIITLKEMATLIDDHAKSILLFDTPSRRKFISDPLLLLVDRLLRDDIIDVILATPGMTPSMRDWMPSRLLRIEMLKAMRFPEWSERKLCAYVGDCKRKEERAFCKLSLHISEMPDHSILSRFRTSMTGVMRINLMVYMLHHFFSSGRLGDRLIPMIDSTDVAAPENPTPLVKLDIGEEHILLYANLECDCGKRRKKRDKSKMFVGYRVHGLSIYDVDSGIAFPVLSLVTAGNHHDSKLLEPLIELAKSIGLEFGIVVADEAYGGVELQDSIREEMDVIVVTPSQKRAVKMPPDVDEESGEVFCNPFCEHAMSWEGYDADEGGHVFTCKDEGTCPWYDSCEGHRVIPSDTKYFGPIPSCVDGLDQLLDLRKACERPFNLLKHMDGVEPCRMHRIASLRAQVTFSQMANLFKVMAKERSVPKENKTKPVQGKLFPVAV